MKKIRIMCAVFAIIIAVTTVAWADSKHAVRPYHEGVECVSCHGVAEPKGPFIKTSCSDCHDAADLAEQTAAMQPVNPHTSPHWGVESPCSTCHKEHRQNVFMCNDCHQHNYDLSGWPSFKEKR